MAAGKRPSVLNEKAAAQRVKGRSHAVAFKNSFCSALFMNEFLVDARYRYASIPTLGASFNHTVRLPF